MTDEESWYEQQEAKELNNNISHSTEVTDFVKDNQDPELDEDWEADDDIEDLDEDE